MLSSTPNLVIKAFQNTTSLLLVVEIPLKNHHSVQKDRIAVLKKIPLFGDHTLFYESHTPDLLAYL